MKKLLSSIIVSIVFLANIFSQNQYYWSGGKKKSLIEDKSSIVIYEKEDKIKEKVVLIKDGHIQQHFDSSNGKYIIIKSKEDDIEKIIHNDRWSKKNKEYGLVKESGDSIFLTHYIVLKFKEDFIYKDLDIIFTKYNAILYSNKYKVFKIFIEDINNVINAANEIYESGKVEFCHPDFLINIKTNSGDWEKQYYLKNRYHYCGAFGMDINIEKAWEITKGCSNIIVAVIDMGVEDHPDLKDASGNSRVLDGFTPSGVTEDGRPEDDIADNHGQACAGIIAASHSDNIKGIAPNVMILPIKLHLNVNQVADPASEVAEGINWAWDPQHGNADILSCSWGTEDDADDVIIDAINNAKTYGRGGDIDSDIPGLGSIVVFSSGNDSKHKVRSEAKYGIAVGALNKYDQPAMELHLLYSKVYTNDGEDLDIMAYGGDVVYSEDDYGAGDIRTIDRTGSGKGYDSGEDYYDHFRQTSAACPQVSGAAALILSINPNLTREQVEDILFSTAIDLGDAGRDDTYGHGKLNVYNAVKKALDSRNLSYGLSDGYLTTFVKTNDNVLRSFVETPGCGLAAGFYWCDIYQASATIPTPSQFLYVGDGLSGSEPNSGRQWVGVIQNEYDIVITTFFYYVRTDINAGAVNKWAPQDPTKAWTQRYLLSPGTDIVLNGIINVDETKEVHALNSVKLIDGFSAKEGSVFIAGTTVAPEDIQCLPNPTNSMTLKSFKVEQVIENINYEEDVKIINDSSSNLPEVLSIFPNPTKGNFYVQICGELQSNARIDIYNTNGVILYSTRLVSNEQNIFFTQNAGVYLVKIYNGDRYYVKRIDLQ